MTLNLFFFSLFVIAGLGSCQSASEKTIVARVHSSPITADELRSRLQEYQFDPKAYTASDALAFKVRVLNELIDEKVFALEAKKRDIVVDRDTLERKLKSFEQDYSPAGFQQMLKQKDLSYKDWKSRMEYKMTVEKLILDITKNISMPTQSQINKYYQDHLSQFLQPAQIHLAQIVVKTKEDVDRIVAALKAGQPFEELAKRYSVTPESAQGGDLGYITKGMMPPPLEKVFLGLPKGQVSSVIQTDYGFHIVRVLDRRSERTRPLEEVRQDIVQNLTEKDREEALASWRRKIISKIKIERNHALLTSIQ